MPPMLARNCAMRRFGPSARAGLLRDPDCVDKIPKPRHRGQWIGMSHQDLTDHLGTLARWNEGFF